MSASLVPLWQWLSATTVARAVDDSLMLTAVLSAVHVVGMTLLTGAILVAGLRLTGAMFADVPLPEVTRGMRRAVEIGLVLNVVTGFLLFAPRAVNATANSTFRFKMTMLAVAVGFHLLVFRPATCRLALSRATGILAMALWFTVAGAGAAYILLE